MKLILNHTSDAKITIVCTLQSKFKNWLRLNHYYLFNQIQNSFTYVFCIGID